MNKFSYICKDRASLIFEINRIASSVHRVTYEIFSTKRGEIQRGLFKFSVFKGSVILFGKVSTADRVADTVESIYGDYPIGLLERI